MTSMFHASSRTLQDQFDTRRIADRIESRLVKGEIDDGSRRFIESVDMFFLATADDFNGMYLSMGNVGLNAHVGLLFIDFERGSRMRLNGPASIDGGDALLSEYPEAQFIVRVRAREVFPNCPRYIHKLKPVEASHFVPRAGCETPVPGWKRSEWARDALPEKDPALDPSKPGL
jgi:uncharacterized protein